MINNKLNFIKLGVCSAEVGGSIIPAWSGPVHK
jgi:hypothetical protein